MWAVPAFIALALLRPRLGLGSLALATALGLAFVLAGWLLGHSGKAIAAEAFTAVLVAYGALRLHDDAPPERLVRVGLLVVGGAALWSVPPLVAGIVTGTRALDRPDLIEVQAARLSLHHPATWRSADAAGILTVAPRDASDAWLTLRAVAAPDTAAMEAVVKPLAEGHGTTVALKVRGDLAGFQSRALGGDAKALFWGCEIFPGPDGQALLLEYGVQRGSSDPRRRIRELDATLSTLQPGD